MYTVFRFFYCTFSVYPPRSGPLSVIISSPSSLTVSWSPPSNISNVGGYMFTVTGQDCGCVSANITTDTTSVSCSGWTTNGQTCSFQVVTTSQDCELTSDPMNVILLLIRKLLLYVYSVYFSSLVQFPPLPLTWWYVQYTPEMEVFSMSM